MWKGREPDIIRQTVDIMNSVTSCESSDLRERTDRMVTYLSVSHPLQVPPL